MRSTAGLNVVKDTHPGYRADIDGLRAIAVLSVLAFHLAPMRLTGGFVGVDIFFVISGFLISSQIFSELGKSKFSYISFYIRRIRRIFPALIAMFLFVLAAGWFLLLPVEYVQLGKHVVGGALYVSNFVLWSEAGYFDVASHNKPLLHLWSLGIEEQFYIVWPLMLAAMWRLGVCRLRWIVALALASFVICWWLAVYEPTAAFFLPFARFWQLMAGAILALILFQDNSAGAQTVSPGRLKLAQVLQIESVKHFCSVVGVVLVVGSILFVDSQSLFPWLRALLPTLGSAMVIAAGPTAFLNRYLLSRRICVLVGLISYPLYLWHWPLLSFLEIVQPPGSERIYKLVAAGAAIVLASATYYFIEKPIRTPPQARVRWLVAGSIVCVFAGMAVVMTSGFSAARGPWGIHGAPGRPETADMQTEVCAHEFGSLFHPELIRSRDFCIKSKAGVDDALVLGDSHANRLFLGLRNVDKEHSYLNLGRGTCIPFLGYDGAWWDTNEPLICQDTMASLLRSDVIKTVKTVFVHGFFVRAFDGTMKMTGAGDLLEQARSTLQLLSATGVRTVLVLDVPVLPFEPSTCIARPALKRFVRQPCEFPAADWDTQRDKIVMQLQTAVAGLPGVIIFDPASVLCDEQICHAERDERLLYIDQHHLSQFGADLVARALLNSIAPKSQ